MANAFVYLFTGPEIGERNDVILNLRVQMKKKLGALDEYTFYASETKLIDVLSLLMNESLFAAARFIVLNGAEQIKKKEDLELLSKWIKTSGNGDNNSVLILVSDENSCDKKLEALIPKDNKRIFWEMFENRKEQWLLGYFKKNGYGITPDAVDLILDMVENNTEALKTECSRFFMFFEKGYTVTVDDVEKFLSHNREESAFTLFDSMCEVSKSFNARFETSLEIYQKIKMSKESSGVQLIAGLTYCFRRLTIWHKIFEENSNPSEFDLKIKGFSSKKAQNQYKNASKIWKKTDVMNILALLAKSDMEIRSTGSIFEDTILQMLLYSIIIKKGQSLELYEVPADF